MQIELAKNILSGRRASLIISPQRMMVKSTQEQIKRAAQAASGGNATNKIKISTLNAEKLYQQKPTFYSFNKVFGNKEENTENELNHQNEKIAQIFMAK